MRTGAFTRTIRLFFRRLRSGAWTRIHPFVEGNGRTARAACYYLIGMRQGDFFPGKKTVPERIRDNRDPYYAALQEADRHWNDGQLNVNALAAYLLQLLVDQLNEQ